MEGTDPKMFAAETVFVSADRARLHPAHFPRPNEYLTLYLIIHFAVRFYLRTCSITPVRLALFICF